MRRTMKKSLITKLQPIEGMPILGHLVWWDCEGVEISAERFKELWTAASLPLGLCMEVRNRSALLKAIKELEKGKLIRRIIDDESQLVYIIVREDVDREKRDVDFAKENSIIFDKYTKELTFRVKGSIPDQIRKSFQKYEGQYTSREVRKVMTRTIKHYGGITVRRAGGMYFVAGWLNRLNAIRSVFSQLPGIMNDFTALGILDTPAYKEQLSGSVKEELLGDFARAKKLNEKILSLAEEGRVRPKSLETRLETIHKLEKKVIQYKNFGIDVETFKGRLIKEVKAPIDKALRALGKEAL